ncbi:hypothetical protein C1645_819007 [Glomus cerebriforme]|uniref:Uncharacterized protein n=1 Tax=Glomus cerebriforme TaxID=658196 RepID=A0A397TBB8_9GLOM|nr:hypothetical protein C1645_819007 [Glomus cerebriforme]
MKKGSIINNTARLIKGISDNTAINRNILYLVGGVVSDFYEDCLAKLTMDIENKYEELTASLETAHDIIAKFHSESVIVSQSSLQTPIITPPPASNSKVKQPNKKKNKELTPHIITGYIIPPNLKNNICDIMLYDISGNWDAKKITEEINKTLGSLIKASVTAKGKYKCVKFSGDWSLAQRQ